MESFEATLKRLLASPPDEGEVAGTRLEEVALSVISKAAAGDLHAAAIIRELTGGAREEGKTEVVVRVVQPTKAVRSVRKKVR